MKYLFTYILLFLFITSCQGEKHDDIVNELDRLTRLYYKADYKEGKALMEKAIDMLTASDNVELKDNNLWAGYGRLYLLERNAGNVEEAEIAFIKTKYWLLKRLEAIGLPPNKINLKLNELTHDNCAEIIQKLDRGGQKFEDFRKSLNEDIKEFEKKEKAQNETPTI